DSREADPGLVGILVHLEQAAVVAHRRQNIPMITNQSGKTSRGDFAQWPVSPYSPYVLSLLQVGVRMVGGVSGIFHRVTGHWGEPSKLFRLLLSDGRAGFWSRTATPAISNRHAGESQSRRHVHIVASLRVFNTLCDDAKSSHDMS